MSKEKYSCSQLSKALWELADVSYDFGSPWTAEQFFDDLQQDQSNYLTRFENNHLVGFVSYRQILDEIEIDNFAVSPAQKGCGTAQSLMDELADEAKQNQVCTIFLEVRSLNGAALNFYKKNRFVKVGKRKGYYHGPDDDGILMARKIRLGGGDCGGRD